MPTTALAARQMAVELAQQVSSERLMADVTWLAADERRGRLAGSPEEDTVGAWLGQRFTGLGLKPFAEAGLNGYDLPFSVPGMRDGRLVPNETGQAEDIIAVLHGSADPGRFICIGAHYDHIGVRSDGQVNNGADDDATGIAAVLEAARLFSQAGTAPKTTIVFVCFSGEEMGTVGASALCEQLQARGLTGQMLLINMEVLGARKGANTLVNVWDEGEASTGPLVQAVQAAGAGLGVRVQRQGRDPGSDARRLVQCGVPAATIDVAWSRENHPYYHTPADDPERIDLDGFTSAVRVAVAALWSLAN